MKRSHVVAAAFFFASSICSAHQDRIVTIKRDGRLEGVPAKFGPAVLHVGFASRQDAKAPMTSLSLRLGRNQTRIPGCLTDLLRTSEISKITAHASWYHDERLVPYYLDIDFPGSSMGKDGTESYSYSLLFNLRTSKLISMQANIARNNGNVIDDTPIDFATYCSAGDRRGFASSAR